MPFGFTSSRKLSAIAFNACFVAAYCPTSGRLTARADTRIDENDLSTRPRQERQQDLTHQVWCADIRGELQIEVLNTGTFHRILMDHTCAVNQDVELATLFFQVRKRKLSKLFFLQLGPGKCRRR